MSILSNIVNAIRQHIHGDLTEDQEARLSAELNAKRSEPLNYEESSDDYLKLYDQPHGYEVRKELWTELRGVGEYTGTDAQNIWLHKQFRREVREHIIKPAAGGTVRE